MIESQPMRLLTTRLRIMLALAWTAYLLAPPVRGIVRHAHTGWLVPRSVFFHGWLLVAFNVVVYGQICWMAFWCISGTVGRERLFMVGMFSDILMWPAGLLLPRWNLAIRNIGAFGLAIATLTGLGLLVGFSRNRANSDRADAPV